MLKPKPENAKNPVASFAPGDFVHFTEFPTGEDIYATVFHMKGPDVWVENDAVSWVIRASRLTLVVRKTPMMDAAEEYEETILAQDMMEIING